MTMYSAFCNVREKTEDLHRAMDELLHWAVIEGKPAQQEHALVSRYDDIVSEFVGLLREAKEYTENGCRAAVSPINLPEARAALIECHRRSVEIGQRFFRDLASREALETLTTLGREQRKSWMEWVCGVKDALDHCREPIDALNDALFQCWQEISECSTALSLSVQSTSTGQINIYPSEEKVH
jgi:hypothetical protein